MLAGALASFLCCIMERRPCNYALIVGAALTLAQLGVAGAANWGSFSRGDCVRPGYRRYSARLNNIKGSWEDQCAIMPATVQGISFAKPDKCENRGIFSGEVGGFDIADTDCNPSWGSFRDDGCKGDGRRQFSSVLWGIPRGQSWEGWCAQSWAEVAGVFFFTPTRCVNNVLNMWGQFVVPDPCCGQGKADDSVTAPIHDQLRRRRLLQSCMAAGGSGGIPPHDNNGFPRTPADACDDFADDDFDADKLAVYLIQLSSDDPLNGQFLVAGSSSGGAVNYDVYVRDTADPRLRFNPSSSGLSTGAMRSHQVRALVVPVIRSTQLRDGNTIPSGSWFAINLNDNDGAPHATRIIATSQLSGCCLTMGWQNSSRTLYMGHVQPDPSASQPFLQNGDSLATHLRQQAQPFEGVNLPSDSVFHLGATDERYGGYGNQGNYRVNVLGLIGRNAIQIIVQFVNINSRRVEKFRDMPFF